MSEAPRYQVTERSYIGLAIVEEGAEVTYLGEPGSNLIPLNASAEKAKAAAADKPTNPTQYIIDAPALMARPVPTRARAAVDTTQGTVLDPGGELDPAAPFDPALQGPDHTPVHLPVPAEDTVTPGREERQAKNAAKAAAFKAKNNDLT